jgi:recombination protein RecA
VKLVKNKVAAPFREAEFDILYGEGISREGDLLDVAVLEQLVEKSGTWYSYRGERLGQGRENARQFLKSNPLQRNALDKVLRERLAAKRAEQLERMRAIPDDQAQAARA